MNETKEKRISERSGVLTKLIEAPCQCGKNEFKSFLLDDKTVLFVCRSCGTIYKVVDVGEKK